MREGGAITEAGSASLVGSYTTCSEGTAMSKIGVLLAKHLRNDAATGSSALSHQCLTIRPNRTFQTYSDSEHD